MGLFVFIFGMEASELVQFLLFSFVQLAATRAVVGDGYGGQQKLFALSLLPVELN